MQKRNQLCVSLQQWEAHQGVAEPWLCRQARGADEAPAAGGGCAVPRGLWAAVQAPRQGDVSRKEHFRKEGH